MGLVSYSSLSRFFYQSLGNWYLIIQPFLRQRSDNVVLDIRDMSHVEHKLVFKKGGKLEYMRSVGKYRLKWNDEDLVN